MIQTFISRIKKPRLVYRIWKKITSPLFKEQWTIFISSNAKRDTPAFADFKPLIQPSDRDWADPFLFKYNDRYFIFIEEKLFSAQHGHIAFLALDNELNITTQGIALKRPYHLSYPFLFSFDNQLFMMPESKGNHMIEIYRCSRFPDQWEFFRTLMPNVNAVDATLIEKDGKWWLFVNIEDESGSTWTNLHLFCADHPLSDSWISHPKNPIVKDIRSARPAGNLVMRDGMLIRPSQDCSVSYGYATNFMQISKLSEIDYAETCRQTFTPPFLKNVFGIHTWNELDNVTIIDALLRRRR